MLPKYDDYFDVGEQALLSDNLNIDPAEIRRPGSETNISLAAAATMAEQVAVHVEDEFLKLWKDTCEGEALDDWAWRFFRELRLKASVSRGQLTIYRNDDTYGDVTIGENVVVTDDAGREFRTVRRREFTGTPISVIALSKATGALANAKANAIRTIKTKLTDPNLKVTNADALVKFERASAASAGTITSGTLLNDGRGNVYRTTEALAFSASQTIGYVPAVHHDGLINYRAPAEADTIYRTESGETLFDTFTISNPVKTGGAFVGGDDKEADGDFKNRLALFFQSARRGTLNAIKYAALKVAGVRFADVIEVDRAVKILIGDRNGIANDALLTEVRNRLEEARAAGIYPFLTAAKIDPITASVTIRVRKGYDESSIEEQVEKSLLAYFKSLPPSTGVADEENAGRVVISKMVDAVIDIEGLYVPSDFVTSISGDEGSESGDYTPDWGKSARLKTVSITVGS